MSQTVEQIISAKWVIPVSGDGQKSNKVLNDYSVVVDKGVILELMPTPEVLSKYQTDHHFQLNDHALIPGLVNIHTHAAMSLFKGLADDLPLMIWLENHIWPAEREWVSDEFCEDGLKLAIAEMIRCGTTTFNDMYFQPNMTAKVAHTLGMRATVGMLMFDFPSVWGNGPEDYLKKGLQLRDDYKHHEMIQFAFAPHAPYTVSDEPLKKIATLSNELGIPVHMHVHETAHEVKEGLKNTGKRPIKRLQELGLMTPNLIAVHMTQLQRGEIELLMQNGVSVAHCPQSNMKLASGICPVQELITAGVNIAIGTDGNASNNDLNMLAEMKSAALLGKVFTGSAQACSAHDILHAATYGGAKALGQEDAIGSIEIGKAADLTAINLNTIESQPVYDPVSQIVYTAGREQVSHVWINGDIKLNNQQLVGIDIDEVIQRANHWKNAIQGQA
ncbi:TRZ/ATZ family hydrolase [Kangiella koreensis]|uniref:Amidohydrolase n=1 Tax=Kangiella koreensis (strain DSM 16069 / JCM 12317 / KCTC 12182 / SW-125) TaxID=523791 RepID=C7RAL9_KANKD|nr:TRZ/ATZ family hydrolase [Kangiella koreensis]ACV26311.1 amidohydrolase [Kangiella koreensis DSM 16069]